MWTPMVLPKGLNPTERIRKILADAQEHARSHGSSGIEPLHLAVALLREGEGVATTAIRFHGGNPERLVLELEKELLPAAGSPQSAELSASSVELLEQAGAESRAMGHAYLGTEHLLLALLRNADAPAARILGQGGFSVDQARARIDWILLGPTQNPPPFGA